MTLQELVVEIPKRQRVRDYGRESCRGVAFRSDRSRKVGQTLSTKPQGVGGTIVNLARRAAYNLASGDQIVRA
jgi:hypothetical protein